VSFAAIIFGVASERVFIVVFFVIDSVRKFWIHPRMLSITSCDFLVLVLADSLLNFSQQSNFVHKQIGFCTTESCDAM
jgi:hypothetical protein